MTKEVRNTLLIGIPSIRQDKRFLASLSNFCKEIAGEYDYEVRWKKNMRLEKAQNELATEFMAIGFDYLLFLDDDHSGHSLAMLDCLINSKSPMATIKTHNRHYPYNSVVFRQYPGVLSGFLPIEYKEGYHKMAMSGFPMTLLRPEVFKRLEAPYFRERESGGNEWATDEEFCERMRDNNIEMMACCDFCLNHDDITDLNVIEKRKAGRLSFKNRLFEQMIYQNKMEESYA